jgi:hypothetical protein
VGFRDVLVTDGTSNVIVDTDQFENAVYNSLQSYAERLAKRLKAMGQANYRNGFEVTLQPKMLELPLKWKAPKTHFRQLYERPVPYGSAEVVGQAVFKVNRPVRQMPSGSGPPYQSHPDFSCHRRQTNGARSPSSSAFPENL